MAVPPLAVVCTTVAPTEGASCDTRETQNSKQPSARSAQPLWERERQQAPHRPIGMTRPSSRLYVNVGENRKLRYKISTNDTWLQIMSPPLLAVAAPGAPLGTALRRTAATQRHIGRCQNAGPANRAAQRKPSPTESPPRRMQRKSVRLARSSSPSNVVVTRRDPVEPQKKEERARTQALRPTLQHPAKRRDGNLHHTPQVSVAPSAWEFGCRHPPRCREPRRTT